MVKSFRLLLIGTGPMAIEYAKVLKAQHQSFIVVGRGQTSADQFQAATGIQPITGGLRYWLRANSPARLRAIVAVSENELGRATLALLDHGCRNILVEKPGAFTGKEIGLVAKRAKNLKAKVYVGYNRRFYASVLAAEKIIARDGGVTSFSFEFTEWSHVISKLNKAPGVKAQWFLHNSTHVIDLAFWLGGWPKKLSAFAAGHLSWHPKASIFAGAGLSKKNAVFSYQANWQSPGRWGVEILTKKHRLMFRPMEKLQIQNIGSVAINEVPINDVLDQKFKPGLFLQVKSFLTDRWRLCTIAEQVGHAIIYSRFL